MFAFSVPSRKLQCSLLSSHVFTRTGDLIFTSERKRERKASEREAKTEEERREHESEVKARGEQEEDANSMHESRSPSVRFKGKYCEAVMNRENETIYVPKGHMVWWRKSWSIRFEDGPHLRTAACSHQSCRKGRGEEKGRERKRKSNQMQRKHVTLGPAYAPERQSNNNSNRPSSSSNRSNALAMTGTLKTVVEETTAGALVYSCRHVGEGCNFDLRDSGARLFPVDCDPFAPCRRASRFSRWPRGSFRWCASVNADT